MGEKALQNILADMIDQTIFSTNDFLAVFTVVRKNSSLTTDFEFEISKEKVLTGNTLKTAGNLHRILKFDLIKGNGKFPALH